MANTRRWVLGLLTCCLISVGAGTLTNQRPVAAQAGDSTLRYRATLMAHQRVMVASPIAGIVKSLAIREGQRIAPDQPVLLLDDELQRIDLRTAQHQVAEAEELLRRAREEVEALAGLLESEAATTRDHARALSDVRLAEARLADAEARQSRARWLRDAHTVLARRGGVVADVRKQVGQGVRAFETVAVVLDTSKLHAVIQVPLADLQRLPPGTEVTFVTTTGKRLEGRVDLVGIEANPGSHTVSVKVRIDNAAGELRAGSGGEILLEG